MQFHNTFGDFVLFLCIHLAHADGYLHPEEEKVIIDKLTKLFPHEGDPKGKYNKALTQYLAADQATLNEFIHYSFRHFNQVTFAQRYKVFTDMYDIINADGKVDEAETKAMNTLKGIIDLGASEKS